MNILALDTASPVLSVALLGPSGKIREATAHGFMTHAENILPLLDRLLKKEKIGLGQVHRWLINRGPGSFTGLRIGFATLKGFLAVRKIPSAGALSLDIIAGGVPTGIGPTLGVLLDAHRGKIYARFYKPGKTGWTASGKPRVLLPHEAAKKFSDGMLLAGDALARYRDTLRDAAGRKKIHFLEEKFWYPKASTLVRWHQTKDQGLCVLKKPADFLPLYLRASEAEERMKGTSKQKGIR